MQLTCHDGCCICSSPVRYTGAVMKLAFSTNAYTRFGLIDAMQDIRAAGFDGIEILADVPHAYPDAIDESLVAQVRRTLDDTGLTVSNVNANCSFGYWRHAPPEPYFEPSLISPNPQHRADRTRLILKTLAFAKSIGARNISITSGRCLGEMSPNRAARQWVESLKPVLDRAASLEIDVGIELEPGLFLEYVSELCEWIERLDHPRFGANLDVGHSIVMGEAVEEIIPQLRGCIWNLHVEDLPKRKHYHMIPGEGTVDWLAMRQALEGIKYDRFMTVELYTHTADPHTAARQSFAFLSRLFQ